jgi:hypothetical protein
MTASRHIARLWFALALYGSNACLSTHDESLGELAPTAPQPPEAGATLALDAGAPSEDAQVDDTATPAPITPELEAAMAERDASHDAALDAALDASHDAGDAARDASHSDACREPWEPWSCR